MRRILLVDDEYPARQLVKAMLNWEETGFEICWEAKNGAEALALYHRHRPDIIISDIQMPVLDGLELLSQIRREAPNLPFIILSCYERFDYARQVIRLGGLDYLIKDTVTPDVLYTALQNAEAILQGPGTATALLPKERPGPYKPPPLSIALQQWLLEKSDGAAEALFACTKYSHYLFIQVGFTLLEGEAPELTRLMQAAELLSAEGECCGCSALPDETMAVLYFFHPSADQAGRNTRQAFYRRLKNTLEALSQPGLTLGVSAIHTAPGELAQALQESQDALGYQILHGTGGILYFSSLQNAGNTVQHRHLEVRIGRLRLALAKNDAEMLKKTLAQLYRKDLQGVMQLNYLGYLQAILWGVLAEEQMQRGLLGPGSPMDRRALEEIENMSTAEEMQAAFWERFAVVLESSSRNTGSPFSQRIRHVMQYIAEHLNQDIGLEELARQFQLHKTHLARVFKEEAGVGVNEYIRRQRIERAKELLLQSQYRVNEIVYEVGFKSPQNFYTLFMRYVGLTPKEYRDRFG